MESKGGGDGHLANIFSRKGDYNCSCIAASGPVKRTCEEEKNASTETSHLLNSSSSHDLSLENAERKESFRTSIAGDESENVARSAKVILDAPNDNTFLQEQTSSTSSSHFSLHTNKTSDLHQSEASDIADEKHREECCTANDSNFCRLEDNNNAVDEHLGELAKKVIGCSSDLRDSFLARNNKKEIQKEIAYACHNNDLEKNQIDLKGNTKSSMQNTAISSFGDDGMCHETDGMEDPRSSSAIFQNIQSSSSGSPIHSQYSKADEKNPVMKNVVGNITEENHIEIGDINKEDSGKSHPFEENLHVVSSKASNDRLGKENGGDINFQPQEATKCRAANGQAGYRNTNAQPDQPKSDSQLSQVPLQQIPVCEVSAEVEDIDEASKCRALDVQAECNDTNAQADKPKLDSQSTQVPLQQNPECEVSAEVEDDVKVCDICGDAGVEEWLAICSRCSDGAEHIYCMRTRLDKVPEGEWLCEECQFKEAHSQMIGDSEVPCETIGLCSNENIQKCLPCVDNKTTQPEIRKVNKELGDMISAVIKRENLEITSATKDEVSKACTASTETTITVKPTIPSLENSSNKLDLVMLKPPALVTLTGQQEGISQPSAGLQTSVDTDTHKLQAGLEPSRGSLSLLKSVSFNNSKVPKVPKVKQLLENIPHKQKIIREPNSNFTRKEGVFRKSASFRNQNSGFCNGETSKEQSPKPPNLVDRHMKQVKEKSMVDMKISTSDHPFVSPLVCAAGVSSVNTDPKIPQNDAKLKKSDSRNLVDNRGSNEGNNFAHEVKKQPMPSSENTSSIRSCKNEDQKPSQLVSKAAELMYRDDKTKDHTFLSNSRQTASAGTRLAHCQRCHETGHITQFCAVDKLRLSAMKPSSERSLRDVDNISNKWKDAAEVFTSKFGTRVARSSDKSEEVSLPSAGVNSEAIPKDFPSSYLCSRSFPLLEGEANVPGLQKVGNTFHVKQKEEHHEKVIFPSRKGTDHNFADDLNLRPCVQIMPEQASMPVIPELNCIWKGAFEVLRTAKSRALFDGLQAHLSTYVSPKVLKLATQFPGRVQLEEVPRLSTWPFQFQENCPKEDNIALFFFAKDIESYEKYYWKLLESMLKNDLALIGNIAEVQLLIFTSNVLPENSQRWNKLFFLWGVFRGRNTNSLADFSGLEKKSSASTLNIESIDQGLPASFFSSLCSPCNQELLRSENLPKAMPCPGNEDRNLNIEKPSVQKVLHLAVADDKKLTQLTSCSLPASCSSATDQGQLPNVPVSCPAPKLYIDIEKLPSDMDSDLTNLDKLASDSDSRKSSEDLVHSGRVSNCEDPTCPVSFNCEKGNERDVQRTEQQRNFRINEAVPDNQLSENVEVDHFSWNSRPAESSSMETMKNSSFMLKPTVDSMMWRDEASCTSMSDEKVHKKMRLDGGGHAAYNYREETLGNRLTSNLQPLPSSFMNGSGYSFMNGSGYCEPVSESSRDSQHYFFPVNLGPTSSKADNLVYVLSSDDEDSPETKAPDLELVLGGNKKPPKPDTLSLLSPKVGENSYQEELPASAVDNGDDALGSLSLSLSF